MDLREIAAYVLVVLAVVGIADGLYFHLWKYKLYKWSETVREHKIHTVRAFLFPATIFLLFGLNSSGLLLWLGIGLAAVDLIVQQIDLIEEKAARKRFEGLSSFEYSVHIWATGMHVLVIGLLLLSKTAAEYSFGAPLTQPDTAPWAAFIAWQLIPGAIGTALLHVWLLRKKYREPTAELIPAMA